ncbi:Tetratricopeptide repeat-containing protein [Sphingobium sp. AP50]|uniref:tetratricopeptide repeat protein n=1 Tax=Sphingobium sp. AP50 TaxID=1884369 RepID=UPI0008CF45CA|nr:tetratricopeptide repeat protein [Sphingobium sp. AP50]SEJ56199.1 Tetratricopeptide repeat-containing protein [Sphingobium sp. AP50]
MRRYSILSSLAIAAVLLTTPAIAKKKKIVVAGPPIIMSDVFRANAQAADAAIKARDAAAAGTQVSALMPTTDFEAYVAAGLRFEVATLRRDVQAQRIALTDMFKTSALPRGDAPRLRYIAGYLSYVVGNYDDAIAQLDYAKALGYDEVDATMLRADIALRRNKPKEARPFVTAAIAAQKAAGKPVPLAWTDRAISMAYQAGDWPEVVQLYRERLDLEDDKADWRAALVNYQAKKDIDPQLRLDLYRLQAANGAMASERDYQAYAQMAEKAGYYAETRTIIEAGRAAGKLTPSQAVTSQLLKSVAPKATKEIASLPVQAKKAAAASNGKDALALADSYFSLSQYPQAVEQYHAALTKGGVDADRVNARLGVALARSGDLAGAQTALAQVSGDWAPVAQFWSAWVEHRNRKAA